MAYDAGARIMNPEFHYINIRPAKHEIEGSGILPAVGGRWVNAKGVHFMETYDSVLKDRAPASRIVVSAAKEALKGNAPVAIDVQSMSEEEREQFRILMVSHGWMPILYEKCKKEEGYDLLRENIEWQPAYETNKLGVEADLHGRTPIGGLFAAGMARTLGINPFTGWSICACTWSGYAAGESASAYAGSTAWKEIDFGYLSHRKRNFLAPFQRKSSLDPDKLVRELQQILFPADVLIIMSETKLTQALEQVLKLKLEKLPQMRATDTRTLIKTRETETMLLSAEMTLRASLMRKERRENIFYRDDYPGPDNKNWLKWIFVEKTENGAMRFTTEPVPLERYRFQPA
jgi:succinate dehydrogenase/fumarate reductase flavoprotein subunit